MIERAYLAGNNGLALLISDNSPLLLMLDGDNVVQRAPLPGELTAFLGNCELHQFRGNLTEAEITAALKDERTCHDALFLTLSALNIDLPRDLRVECAVEAEHLFESEVVQDFVLNRLLLRVNPHLDVETVESVEFASAVRFRQIVQRPVALQSQISLLQKALHSVFSTSQALIHQQSALELTLLELGFYSKVHEALSRQDLLAFNALLVGFAVKAEVKALGSYAPKALIELQNALKELGFRGSQPRLHNLMVEKDEASGRAYSEDRIGEMILGYRPSPRNDLSVHQTITRIDKQVQAISGLLHDGNLPLAEKYLEDLIAFNFQHGEKEDVVKSLCRLAMIAVDANQLEMADRLSSYALQLQVDDVIVHSVRAEVLKRSGELEKAAEIYEGLNRTHFYESYVRCGFAEVLQELGRYKDASRIYQSAMKDFPDDPVPFNGYAGVLKREGRVPEAIRFLSRIIGKFDGNAVTRTVFAGLLQWNGDFESAIRQYKQALDLDRSNPKLLRAYSTCLRQANRHDLAFAFLAHKEVELPDEPTVPSVRGDLLRIAGKLPEALDSYAKALKISPSFPQAKHGKNAALILAGRADEVLQSNDDERLCSETDWYGFYLTSMALLSVGEVQEASRRFAFGLENTPWFEMRSRFRRGLGFARMNEQQFKSAIDVLQQDLASDSTLARDSRILLMSHAQLALGREEIASNLTKMVHAKDPLLEQIRTQVVGLIGKAESVDLHSRLVAQEFSLLLAA